MGHKNGSISTEISDDVEGNDTGNDGYVCYLSEIDEEYIDMLKWAFDC